MAKSKKKRPATPGHSLAEGFTNASKPTDDCALEEEAELDKASYSYGTPAGPGGYSRSPYAGGYQSYRSPYGNLHDRGPTRNELAAGHPDLRQSNADPDSFLSRALRRDLSSLGTEGRGNGIREGIPGEIALRMFDARSQAGSYDGMNAMRPQSFIRPGSHSAPIGADNGSHHSDSQYRAQSLAVPLKNATPTNAQALDIMRGVVRRSSGG